MEKDDEVCWFGVWMAVAISFTFGFITCALLMANDH